MLRTISSVGSSVSRSIFGGIRTSIRKPETVDIKPQRMGFEFSQESTPKYWLADSYFISHVMNAMSILFPEGEAFFVEAVRNYRDQITDPELKKEVRGFIGQEAMHSLEHEKLNQHVRDQGMPVDELEGQLTMLLDFFKKNLPHRHQLAATCGLEHFTAMMADALLERSDVREDMHESMQKIWVWHAVEETEHKGVAYDVFQAVGGTYAERAFYLAFTTAMLGVVTTYFSTRMMWQDRENFTLKDAGKSLWRMWGYNGVFSSMVPTWLEYFKPNYHPWQHDNSELIARFKPQIEGYISPEFRQGNRRKGATLQ